ncbi:flagellin [Boseaceae bacterium BT-24-1]|nr:flagellin [Boseaceae bacterium BT-24-1]
MATVSLSSGVRSALSSLGSTKTEAQQAQFRLATGKKVNSAVDNPVNFFTASGLNDRAGQLTDLLDGISNGVQTIQAASKGLDSITSLVKSLQSTVKQAQNDAASNRPKVTSNVAGGLATTAEATLRNSSQREAALNKLVIDDNGVTANTATAGYQGNLGVAAAGAGTNAVQIQAGNTTYSFSFDGTTTLRDLVNNINSSGIATASVGNDGQLTVTGSGSDALTIEAGTLNAGVFAAVAGDNTALFGTADNTAVVASGNSAVRTTLVKQFNDLRDQIDGLAKDAGFNGINLLSGDKLSITFNEKTGANKNKLDVQGETVTATNLGIGSAVDGTATGNDYNIQNDADLAKAADALTNVLTSLRATSSSLGSQLSVVETRQNFTKDMVNTLTAGADNLTLADTNEEGAKLLALQTRQQLSQTALSLSNQADQAVLRLF